LQATHANRGSDFLGNSMPSGLFPIDWHAARKEKNQITCWVALPLSPVCKAEGNVPNMAINRIHRYQPARRIAQQSRIAAECSFAVVPMVLSGGVSPAPAEVYQVAFTAAQRQVAQRQRLLEPKTATWNLN
jgi:hypothetical protein